MQRKVRIGIVGIGSFSRLHIKGALDAVNAELVALADPDETRLHQHDEKFKVAHLDHYTDYNEMLARDDIEAVIVASNDQAHKELTVAALRAGKHVLCEKPMALTMDDCIAMIEAEKETGKKLMVGQVTRYDGVCSKAVQMIKDGVIGDIYYVESEYAHDYSKIPGTNQWRMDPARHGIIGGGCHAVDLLRSIAGNPIELSAYSNNKCLTDWPVYDCSVAIFKFPNNVIGKVMSSIGCKRSATRQTSVYGTKGTLVFTRSNIDLFTEHFSDTLDIKDQFKVRIPIPVQKNDHNVLGEITDFCEAIIEDKPVPCPGKDGAITAYTCMAIVEASQTGKPVTLNYDFAK